MLDVGTDGVPDHAVRALPDNVQQAVVLSDRKVRQARVGLHVVGVVVVCDGECAERQR